MNSKATIKPNWSQLVLLVAGAALLVCCGCSRLLQLSGSDSALPAFLEREKAATENARSFEAEFQDKIETPMLGDYISMQGNNLVPIRGIGLVVNLNGTGGNPPPSSMLTKLRHEMSRMKVRNQTKVLADPSTALVVVTAYVPPNCREKQKFDVVVTLPRNSDATSLKGGYLLPTRLAEETDVQGYGTKKGHELAIAEGPVLTTFGADEEDKDARGLLYRGTIPGGARSTKDRDMQIVLRRRFQSIRKSKQIADAINARFHHFDRFNRPIPLAEGKTNALVKLSMPATYQLNPPRYHHVIRSIPVAEDEVGKRLRMDVLSNELLDPATSEQAAVHLEAIGRDAKPFLRSGLDSEFSDVRFFSAEALAYLGDDHGADVLKQAAREEPAFRVYALSALATLGTANAVLALRELTDADSLETQYGAVRAIAEIDSDDRHLNTRVFEKNNRRLLVLHRIHTSSRPAVHITRRRFPEVTVLGTDQELQLPAVLNAGHKIRVMGRDGDDTVQVTRYHLQEEPTRRICSRKLVDILEVVGEMGAAYPDMVQLLIEADRQHNLAGELGVDRLPQAGRSYASRRDSEDDSSAVSRRVGNEAQIPGLFDRVKQSQAEGDGRSKKSSAAVSSKPAAKKQIVAEAPADASAEVKSDRRTPKTPQPESSSSTDDRSSSLLRDFLQNPFGQHQL